MSPSQSNNFPLLVIAPKRKIRHYEGDTSNKDEIVTQMVAKSYDWIKKISSSLLPIGAPPLVGAPPPFPIKAFAEHFSKIFEKKISFTVVDVQPRAIASLTEGLQGELQPLTFAASGMEGSLFWILAEQDIQQIASRLLSVDAPLLPLDLDQELVEAFYRFLAFQATTSLQEVGYNQAVPLYLESTTIFPDQDALTFDILISIDSWECKGRLLLSEQFQNALRSRFVKKNKENSLLDDALQVPLHLEVGTVHMSPEEWKNVAVGDFLIVDSLFLNANGSEGTLTMTVNGSPLLKGTFAQGKMTITEPSK